MPRSRVLSVHLPDSTDARDSVAAQELRDGIAAIQRELKVAPGFPEAVVTCAEEAAAHPRLPDLDRTDIPFVTIDPASSMDLDQAVHLESREGGGYRVHYAIADLLAFIQPGDALDGESRQRGQTLYGADSKIPLHPKVISEAAGSLLPDQVRPAALWTIDLDTSGEAVAARVERARVRSRAKLSYDGVQRTFDDGTVDPMLALLKEVGERRLALEAARGGVSLPLPEQEIVIDDERWRLEFRSLLPVETWNAQISLLTGICAAKLMVDHRVGILRTLPPPQEREVARLRLTAKALDVPWPADLGYADFVRTLDPRLPRHAAMAVACTRLLRGSGYVAFNGELPEQYEHSAVAAAYAHVTAPLRRLVDRYATEVCLALCADSAVPEWVLNGMTDLPELMRESTRLANAYQNAILDLVEAEVLKTRVGETFAAVVVEVDERDPRRGALTIADPAIETTLKATSPLPLGDEVQVKLARVDVPTRSVEFTGPLP